MRVLALDTTTRTGSVAVLAGGVVRAELRGDPRLTHGQRLPGELMRALDEARITLAEVDLLAVAAGPGSFTGLRVGIAAMQGLAMATGRKVVPVSTLDALARAADADSGLVAAWMDAQRGQVFAALYDAAALEVLRPPSSLSPDETLAGWGDVDFSRTLFIGDGAVRYADRIAAAGGRILEPPPLAAVVARLAAAHPERAVNPHAVVPIYVRRPDAELARERRAGDT